MPGYVVDGSKGGKKLANASKRFYVSGQEILGEKSPRSPFSTHSLTLSGLSSYSDCLELVIHRRPKNSIEQLCQNIWDMQSSDYSLSRRSFLSIGEESRIDSELRFLAGIDYGFVEMKKEDGIEKNGGLSDSEGDKGFDDISESNSPTTGENSRTRSSSECSRRENARSKGIIHGKPPTGKQKARDLKRLSDASLDKNMASPRISEEKWRNGSEYCSEAAYLGPYLLRQARYMMVSGDHSSLKALELALRAMKSFEYAASTEPNLDFVLCLHVVGTLYCKLGRCSEAIPVLEKSIEIPVMELGQSHALAKFSGCMQLGDTYAMLDQIENSIMFYKAGLEIQRQVLGENDVYYGDSCRYIAEAHVQAMQFDDAEKLCLIALDIHKENTKQASQEEAEDRMLLGLIYDCKGDYENSLKHYILARMIMEANGQNTEVAAVECNVGSAYVLLERYDEAIFAYQKALNVFKSCKGENHSLFASVLVSLAYLYNKMGNVNRSKSYCENALRIYCKPLVDSLPEEVANGLVEMSAIYESMNEPKRALKLLQKALTLYDNAPGQLSLVAGIEAQMGVLNFTLENYFESYNNFKDAILKFGATGDKKSALFGFVLNQLGLACVQLSLVSEAADSFQDAKNVLGTIHGPTHDDTLRTCINLAGAYEAMGRTNDAIEILQSVLDIKDKLGTINADIENERSWLNRLIREKRKTKK